jgi:hypothetical protein
MVFVSVIALFIRNATRKLIILVCKYKNVKFDNAVKFTSVSHALVQYQLRSRSAAPYCEEQKCTMSREEQCGGFSISDAAERQIEDAVDVVYMLEESRFWFGSVFSLGVTRALSASQGTWSSFRHA